MAIFHLPLVGAEVMCPPPSVPSTFCQFSCTHTYEVTHQSICQIHQTTTLAASLAALHWSLEVLCALLEWPCWILSSSPLVACCTSPNVAIFIDFCVLSPAGQAHTTFPSAMACSGDSFHLSGPWAPSLHPILDNFNHLFIKFSIFTHAHT